MIRSTAKIDSGIRTALFMAAIIIVFVSNGYAITPTEYKSAVDNARTHLSDLLVCIADAESGDPHPFAEKFAIASIIEQLPVSERIESNGETIEVSNQWLHDRLTQYQNETDLDQRAINITEADELLAGISAKIGTRTAKTSAGSKDEQKRKLAEILARAEYQKPEVPKQSVLGALITRFLEWLQSLFPNAPILPSDSENFASLARILQIGLLALIIGLIVFLLYRFAPVLFPGFRRKPSAKKSSRTILGETITADESPADLFSEAERLAREGEIRAAIRKGYIALLCELADKHAITLEHHKTNRDYLRDTRSRQTLFASMRTLTSRFERHWYGDVAAADGDWNEFREDYKKAVGGI